METWANRNFFRPQYRNELLNAPDDYATARVVDERKFKFSIRVVAKK